MPDQTLESARFAMFTAAELRTLWTALTHDDGIRYQPEASDEPTHSLVRALETNMQLRHLAAPDGGWMFDA